MSRLLLFAGVCALLTGDISAQDASPTLLPTDPVSRDAATVAASVVPPVQAAASISALAGEYSYGNGFDQNCTLEISPDGRFLYKRCNCEVVVDQAKGVAVIDNGVVRLNAEKPPKAWARGTSDMLVPIAWGQRLYLVPQNDLVGFSNHVNRGTEPVTRGSMGSYYLREGDWDRPATGKPDLPGDWKNKLLDEPLEGRVAGKDPSGRWIINVGKNRRVYDNMELSAWTPDLRKFVTLKVTDTGTDTSAVEIVGAPADTPILGWIVYSRVAPPQQQVAPMPAATGPQTQPVQQQPVPQPTIAPQPMMGPQPAPMAQPQPQPQSMALQPTQ